MLSDLRYRLRALFRRADMERELEAELQLHYEREVDKLVARGVPLADARRQARLALGGTARVKEETREVWGISAIDSSIRDVRYALRTLRRHPGVAACALVIFAIGTGASTAVFTVLDRTVFKPLPVANADRLVRLQIAPDESRVTTAPYAAFEQLRNLTRSLERLSYDSQPIFMLTFDTAGIVSPTSRGARAVCVTGDYFDLLGVRPHVGRVLQSSDDNPAAEGHVAVGTYRFWKAQYGLDPEAVGSEVRVASNLLTIVGFLPEGFEGIRKGVDVDVYVPMAAMGEACVRPWGDGSRLEVLGLVAHGSSRDAASAELAQLWDGLRHSSEFAPGVIAGQLVVSDASRGIAAVDRDQQASLYLLTAAVALIVLIGCFNTSCLLVLKGVARRHEIALKRALGATSKAILRQSLIESCLLAAVGGACGVALAALGSKVVLVWLRWGDRPLDLAIDGRVFGFSLALVLVTGVVSGLLPVLDAVRTTQLQIHQSALLRPFRSGKVLIVLEVALSLMLVAGAAMLLRGVSNLRSIPLGFDARNVVVVTLWPDYARFPPEADRERYMTAEASRLRERLVQVPGMERATVGPGRTFTGGLTGYVVARADVAAGESVTVDAVHHVDDRYFDVLEIPLLAGRGFFEGDNDGGDRVAILNRSLAERLFGHAAPLGQRIAVGTTAAIVVGVAGDIHRRSLREPPVPMVYLPLWQRPPPGRGWAAEVNVQVRTRRSPDDVMAAIESEMASDRIALRPSAFEEPTTLEATVGASYADDTIRMQGMSLLAAIVLVLVLGGIYGLASYAVATRSREIAVRMAIGAAPNRIVRLILRDSLTLVGIGMLLGLPGALGVMRVLSSYSFQVTALDSATIVGTLAIVLLTAVVAAAGPVWRSTRVDPVDALRGS